MNLNDKNTSKTHWAIQAALFSGALLVAFLLMLLIGLTFGDDLLNSFAGQLTLSFSMLGLGAVTLKSDDIKDFGKMFAVVLILCGFNFFFLSIASEYNWRVATILNILMLLALLAWLPVHWLIFIFGAYTLLGICILYFNYVEVEFGRVLDVSSFYFLYILLLLIPLIVAFLIKQCREQGQGLLSQTQSSSSLLSRKLVLWLQGYTLGLLLLVWWFNPRSFLISAALNHVNPFGLSVNTAFSINPVQFGVVALLLAMSLAPLMQSGEIVRFRRYPSRWLGIALFLPIAILSVWEPLLSVILFVAALAWVQRWRKLLILSGLALLWLIGSFYYSLQFTLLQTAGVFVIVGIYLAAISLLAQIQARQTMGGLSGELPSNMRQKLLAIRPNKIALAVVVSVLLLIATLVGKTIIGYEYILKHGEKIYLEIAPVDPRSIIQGDYMELDWEIIRAYQSQTETEVEETRYTKHPPQIIIRADENGVWRYVRTVKNGAESTLQAGEKRLILTQHKGNLTVVSNAWFFPEGQAEKYSAIRYGEFRLLSDGRALLVGVADAQRKRIGKGLTD